MNAINHRKCVTDEGLKNVCAYMDTVEEREKEIFGDVPVKNLCFFFTTSRWWCWGEETDDDGILIFPLLR